MDPSQLVEAIKADLEVLDGGMKLLHNHKAAIEEAVKNLSQMKEGLDSDEVNQVVEELKDFNEMIRLTTERIVKFNLSLKQRSTPTQGTSSFFQQDIMGKPANDSAKKNRRLEVKELFKFRCCHRCGNFNTNHHYDYENHITDCREPAPPVVLEEEEMDEEEDQPEE